MIRCQSKIQTYHLPDNEQKCYVLSHDCRLHTKILTSLIVNHLLRYLKLLVMRGGRLQLDAPSGSQGPPTTWWATTGMAGFTWLSTTTGPVSGERRECAASSIMLPQLKIFRYATQSLLNTRFNCDNFL